MILRGAVSALRTLTILPVPGPEPQKKYNALVWFVFTGLFIGFLQYLTGETAALLTTDMLVFSGLLISLVNYLLTGALHLDGLADFFDAFGTFHTRQKTLDILKDSRTGVFGTASIVFAILWRVSACHVLAVNGNLLWLIFCIGMSRSFQALIFAFLPYARDSRGKAHGYRAPALTRAVLILGTLALFAVTAYQKGLPEAAVATGAGLTAILYVCIKAMKRLGGITGDCTGAASELFELVFLTAVCVCVS